MTDWEPIDGTPRGPVSREPRLSRLVWLWLIAAPACFVQTAEPVPPSPGAPPGNPSAAQAAPQAAPPAGEGANGETSEVADTPAAEPQPDDGAPAPEAWPGDEASLVATDVESHVEKKWGGFASLIPFQAWPELGAHAVGLLMASGQQP